MKGDEPRNELLWFRVTEKELTKINTELRKEQQERDIKRASWFREMILKYINRRVK